MDKIEVEKRSTISEGKQHIYSVNLKRRIEHFINEARYLLRVSRIEEIMLENIKYSSLYLWRVRK